MLPDESLVTHGLKEWAIAVEALRTGDLILLMRKGGIADPAQPFACPHNPVLLFPTFEHQSAQFVRTGSFAGGQSQLEPCIRAWAQITHSFGLDSLQAVQSLAPFHIWTADFVVERFRWRPQCPLQILCLRTYQLKAPIQFEQSPRFSGCRSWIPLEISVRADTDSPALSDEQYLGQLKAIEAALQHHLNFTLESCQL
jgi:hypothetical protein